jgi:hypothetical protein
MMPTPIDSTAHNRTRTPAIPGGNGGVYVNMNPKLISRQTWNVSENNCSHGEKSIESLLGNVPETKPKTWPHELKIDSHNTQTKRWES